MASSNDSDDGDRKRRREKTNDNNDTKERQRSRSHRRNKDRDDEKDRRRRRKDRKHRKKRSSSSRRHRKDDRRKKRKRSYSSSSSSESSSESSDGSESEEMQKETKKVVNKRLLEKLSARGETLEEREERRAQRRTARITSKFGYTAEENPFNDPNLHEAFSWKKKEDKIKKDELKGEEQKSRSTKQDHIFEEIEKVRRRRDEREQHFEEMERIKGEESRMKELENYDEWARKEEEFHLQQQRQRSAIRLVEGREKPVDVLAKNLLLFGLSEEERKNRAAVKYQERYNAMDELQALEAELEEPHVFLKDLKLNELEELLQDIEVFRKLEREALIAARNTGRNLEESDDNPILKYWDALHLVASDEIKFLKTGGAGGSHSVTKEDIQKLFEGQSQEALTKMQDEIVAKLRRSVGGSAIDTDGGVFDIEYWQTVLSQLTVHLAKVELSDLHSKMLVRQLERLEKKKEALSKAAETAKDQEKSGASDSKADAEEAEDTAIVPKGVEPGFGDLDEELGLSSEVDLHATSYAWQERYRPRKPRYFNRVKTGYDWNKYNQSHYDHDNPPPKTVQGYKFNIFYPDLIDRTQTPQYSLERAATDEFCIIRFRAGPPYEDVAFKIINREWNRSRRRGFRCTFERGVLSLYFNFKSHWYRR